MYKPQAFHNGVKERFMLTKICHVTAMDNLHKFMNKVILYRVIGCSGDYMTVEWQPVNIHKEAHKVLDEVKARTGYSKSEILHRYILVLNACLDMIERGYEIQIIPYVRRLVQKTATLEVLIHE